MYIKAVLLWLRLHMDQDGPDHALQGEEAYFDGCHSRCVGYKTLALFVYHPSMWHKLRLATMGVKNESTHEIIVFWELFNEILSDTQGRDYKFNPRANYCATQKVFGLYFVTSKVVSFQMHYKNDVHRVSFRIG